MSFVRSIPDLFGLGRRPRDAPRMGKEVSAGVIARAALQSLVRHSTAANLAPGSDCSDDASQRARAIPMSLRACSAHPV
jgi:hypothetical protein